MVEIIIALTIVLLGAIVYGACKAAKLANLEEAIKTETKSLESFAIRQEQAARADISWIIDRIKKIVP